MAQRPDGVRTIEIAPRTVLFVAVIVGGCWLLYQLWTIAVVVLVALMLVGTLAPLVAALERRGMRRTYALLLVFFSLFALVSALLLLTVPALVAQLLTLLKDAPARRDQLVRWLDHHRVLAPLAGPVRDAGVNHLTEEAGRHLIGYSSRIIAVIGYAVTAVFLAFYLLADGERAKGGLFALVPRSHHVRLARILIHLETIVGGYVRGQLITSAAMFVFTFLLLTIFGVGNALSLSVFAALVDVIPFIGGILATAPALAMAAPHGSGPLIGIAIAMFVYQEFESRVLVPRVYGHVLRLSPAAVLVALLAGGTLMGILGALLALPVAAGLRMIVQELRVELPGDVSADPVTRARVEEAERRYVEAAAGARPAEAAAVATAVAVEVDLDEAVDEAVAPVVIGDGSPPREGSATVAAIVDPRATTLPMVEVPAALRGGGAGDRRAGRGDPGPTRHDRRPGSWARPTGRRH